MGVRVPFLLALAAALFPGRCDGKLGKLARTSRAAVRIRNDQPRRDVDGEYLDAHDGKIVAVNGTYFLCEDPSLRCWIQIVTPHECPFKHIRYIHSSPSREAQGWAGGPRRACSNSPLSPLPTNGDPPACPIVLRTRYRHPGVFILDPGFVQ